MLRKELMFLLAIADYSHSELQQLVPRKSGLASSADAGHAVEQVDEQVEAGTGTEHTTATARFDEELHALAEFRNPQFEAANSKLSKGSFSLKSVLCRERVFCTVLEAKQKH